MVKYSEKFLTVQEEENFLNEMAAAGQVFLRKTLMLYYFEEASGDLPYYKVVSKLFLSEADFNAFLSKSKDQGWALIKGTRISQRLYFKSFTTTPEINVFDDLSSEAIDRAKGRIFSSTRFFLVTILVITFLLTVAIADDRFANIAVYWLAPLSISALLTILVIVKYMVDLFRKGKLVGKS